MLMRSHYLMGLRTTEDRGNTGSSAIIVGKRL